MFQACRANTNQLKQRAFRLKLSPKDDNAILDLDLARSDEHLGQACFIQSLTRSLESEPCEPQMNAALW